MNDELTTTLYALVSVNLFNASTNSDYSVEDWLCIEADDETYLNELYADLGVSETERLIGNAYNEGVNLVMELQKAGFINE